MSHDHQIRRQLLLDLLRQQGHKCYWCKQRMWMRSDFDDVELKNENHKAVYANGRWHPLATVDHVVPISQGGSDDPENLVAACASCNMQRNRVAQTREWYCRDCGVRLGSTRKERGGKRPKYCGPCREWRRLAWEAGNVQ